MATASARRDWGKPKECCPSLQKSASVRTPSTFPATAEITGKPISLRNPNGLLTDTGNGGVRPAQHLGAG